MKHRKKPLLILSAALLLALAVSGCQSDAAAHEETRSAASGEDAEGSGQDSAALEESEPAQSSSSSPDSAPESEQNMAIHSGGTSVMPEKVKTSYVVINIPPYSTYPQIRALIAEKTGLSEEEIDAEVPSALHLLPDASAAEQSFFPLEGYILSGDYAISEDGTNALTMLVESSLQQIDDLIRAEASEYSVHELLTIASIVMAESNCGGAGDAQTAEMPHIAAVIENRLRQSMQLQMDFTARYGDETLAANGAPEDVIAGYDTYEAQALPPGPICSPQKEAVEAALSPVSCDDLFFVFDEDETYYYAETYEEHLENCRRIGLR